MSLWHSKQPKPTPPADLLAECETQRQVGEDWAEEQHYADAARALADVKAREIVAAEKVKQASALCAELDAEFKSWQMRRDQATKRFYDALAENKNAQDARVALTKPPLHPLAVAPGRAS